MLARNMLSHIRRTIEGQLVSNLFDPGGKPLGWAHHEERRIIRDHLKRRGRYRAGWSEMRISEIQRRLHKYDLTYRQLHVLYKQRWAREAPPARPEFTLEELDTLVDYFGEANDPITQSIGAKAALMVNSMRQRMTS